MTGELLKQSDNVCIDQNLACKAMEILRARGFKLGIAESCTGGLLTYHFTALSGASDVLEGAMISYANAIKSMWLGVDEESLRMHGAVSERVVREMCRGILQESEADVVLATSGVAGPTGGTESKPVGSVYIGLQLRGLEAEVFYYHFTGDRKGVQSQACKRALELLIQRLEAGLG